MSLIPQNLKESNSSNSAVKTILVKQDSQISLTHESPFIRTASNMDIFNALPLDDLRAPVTEWSKLGKSEIAMNSQSYSTLIDEESNYSSAVADGEPNKTLWTFDGQFTARNFQDNNDNGISPSQLKVPESFQYNQPHLLPPEYHYLDQQRALDYPNSMDSNSSNNYNTSTSDSARSVNHYHEHHPGWGIAPQQNFEFPVIPHSLRPLLNVRKKAAGNSTPSREMRPLLTQARRRSSQLIVFCKTCKENIGTVLIRGFIDGKLKDMFSIVCTSCSQKATKDQGQVAGKMIKKSQATRDSHIFCEVCNISTGKGCKAPDSDGLKSEFVCAPCNERFMFCSECGGGGKQRTGKWRPRELFECGRRTCSLPHIRVGVADFLYKVIPLKDITPEILRDIQDVFFDCLLSLYCVPSVMKGTDYPDFNAIKAEIEKLWLTTVLNVLTDKVLFGKKYVAIAWIQKRHRNKGSGKFSNKKSTPWIKKFGLNGIISSPSNEEEDNQCCVAFSIAEWDIEKNDIFLAQMIPRSAFIKTMDSYVELIRNCVQEINENADKLKAKRPKHIWCWTKGQHARLQMLPVKMKFLLKAEYLMSNPAVNPTIFERLDYDPLKEKNITIFATSTKNFQ